LVVLLCECRVARIDVSKQMLVCEL
jgi:hypothetical protein